MPRIAVLWLGLSLLAASAPVEGQTPSVAATQVFLEYADSAYTEVEPFVLEIDSFLDSQVVAEIADDLGLAHGPRSELVQCSEDRRNCRIIPDGRLLRVTAQTANANSREWRFRIFLASDVALPDGRSRIFGVAREVTIALSDAWRVIDDKVLFQTQ